MKNSFKLLGLLFLLSSCGENFHLTGFKLSAGVTLPSGGVNIGQNYNLSGGCEPDGATVTLSSGDFSPTPVTATCVNGSYTAATPVQFSGTGPGGVNPVINVSIDDGRGPPVSNDEPTVINNAVPVINDDSANASFNSPVTIDVDVNDSDAENDMDLSSMNITMQPPASEGSCIVTGAPNYDVTFTPASNFAGTSTCTYELCDNAGLCDTAVIDVVVHPGSIPVANDDSASAPFGNPVTINVDSNDTDADSNLDPSSINIQTNANPATQGTCSVGGAPGFDVTFNPVSSNFAGTVTCVYEICDLNSPSPQCDTANAVFTVLPGSAPVAADDNASGPMGSPIVVDVDANDNDADSNLDLSSINIPSGGNANPSTEGSCVVGGAPGYDITFTPVSGFSGSTSCTYEICDLNTPTPQCDTASININVNAPPIANDDTANGTSFGAPVTADHDANDVAGSGTLDLSSTNIPSGGNANPATEGMCSIGSAPNYDVIFTPVSNFTGSASCSYEICNSNALCDTATITFDPADGSAPIATNDTASGAPGSPIVADVDANDSDPDGNLDLSSINIPSGGNANPTTEGSCAVGGAPGYDITFTPVSGFMGSATCTYEICDLNAPTPQCDTADVVFSTFNPPVANDDTASDPDFGDPVVISEANILTNDVAGSGTLDASTISIDTDANNATQGSCSVSGSSPYDITFTPIANFVDAATCIYEVCDSNGLCDTATITFDPADGSAPIASDDMGSGNPGSPITVNVATNDSDPDGNLNPASVNLTGTQPNPSTEGSCDASSAPNVVFTPVSGFTGTATCEYSICDSNLSTPQCDTGSIAFTINAPPTATDDTASDPDFGDPVVISEANILTNDVAGSGTLDASTISIDTNANAATEGACSVSGSSPYDITFTPISNFVDAATCVYEVCNTNGLCDTATITFDPADGSAPVATNDTASGAPGSPIVADVDANDNDVDNNLDLSSINIPSGGNANPATEGVCSVGGAPGYDITFTPVSGFMGSATCTYEICDSNLNTPQCDTADIVFSTFAPPVANDDTASDPDFGDPVVLAEATILSNDTNGDGTIDPSTISIDTNANAATEGTCAVNGSSPYDITFTPIANFVDTATCVYEVCDSNGLCDTATITFDPADGSAPVATNDNASGAPGSPIVADVDANDSDPDGNLDLSSINIPSGGNANPATEGVCSVGGAPGYDITFTPVSGFMGSATCTYEICDSNLNTPQCDTADVVFSTFNPPVANDDTANGASFGAAVTADADSNDTAGDGTLDPSTINITSDANNGTEGACTIGAAPNYDVIFTPVSNFTGTAQCTYEICDSNSLCDTAIITFDPHDGAIPVANNDTATTSPGIAVVVDVVGGSTSGAVADTDADGNLNQASLSIDTDANNATEGACTVTNAPVSDITFTPVSGFTGVASCIYEVCDSNSPSPQCGTATLSVTVNAPPSATDDSASDPDFGDPVVISEATIIVNDTAGSGTLDPSTITIDTNANAATEGTCSVSGSSPYDITFTPIANFVDTATCVYEICNSNSLCDTATITFDPADGSAPVANNDAVSTAIDTAVTVDVTADNGSGADSDADGNLDSSSVTLTANQPNPTTEGTCAIATSPNIQFTPVTGFTGTANCEYQVCDSNLNTPQCDTATLAVTVNAACGGQKYIYSYEGVDQHYPFASYPDINGDKTISGGTIDSTVTHIHVKAWGAGGGGDFNQSGDGAPGGYTESIFLSSLATSYAVMVGQGGQSNQTGLVPGTYGFGGGSVITAGGMGSAGGLTGIFTGISSILSSDQARSVVIAGGGGGADWLVDDAGMQYVASPGNAPNSGGAVNLEGSFSNSSNQGPGGGGYEGGFGNNGSGGSHGLGGSAFTLPSALLSIVQYQTDGYGEANAYIPPEIADSDYESGVGEGSEIVGGHGAPSSYHPHGGNGLLVVTELCAGNDNPPFAAIDRKSTTPGTNATFDVGANDADVDGDLDLSSITIDTQGPVAEGTCTVGSNPGEIDFAPASGFTGTTSCVYEICDSSGTRCDTATLEVEVQPTAIEARYSTWNENIQSMPNWSSKTTLSLATITDGDTSTSFSVLENNMAFVGVDFGQPVLLDRVVIHPDDVNGHAPGWIWGASMPYPGSLNDVIGSNDGITWVNISNLQGNPGNNDPHVFEIVDPTSYRYIGVTMNYVVIDIIYLSEFEWFFP